MSYLDKRLERAIEKITEKGQAMLVTDDVTRAYLFGFSSSAGYGYISKNRAVLVLDFRYFEKAKIAQSCGEISKRVDIIEANKKRQQILSELLCTDKVTTLLFEDRRMTYSAATQLMQEHKETQLVAAGGIIEGLRAVKDEHELECIITAQSITDKAFSYICSFIKKGMTEEQIALELEHYMRKNGADGIAFDTICVSGKKSSMPHGEPDKTIISEGFLTIDFGASFKGYCSDMTRTLCIGEPDAEMKNIYDTVLKAQKAAFDVIVGNCKGSEVDKAARDVIAQAGYGECFGHSTGHSLGLEIHESPNFSPSEKENVPTGAVVSVEPGIYLSGKCGVRIEDIVFLTENGYKNLTNSSKEYIIVR